MDNQIAYKFVEYEVPSLESLSNSFAYMVKSKLLKGVELTKEEREAEKKKFYVGNGRVFWGDGVIPKNEINTTNIIEDIESESTELPF